jgi:hypothetical protein
MNAVRRGPVVLHPLLFAAFPVLFLFAHNLSQGLSIGNLLGPLATVVGIAAVLFLALSLIFRSATKGGLIVSLLLLLFFSYGYVYLGLRGLRIGGVEVGRHLVLLPLLGTISGAIVVAVGRARGPFLRLTQAFNVVAAGLVLVNLFNIGWFEYRTSKAAGARPGDVRLAQVPQSRKPDIYYIMLEEYGGLTGLKSQFGYDNAPFLDALKQRGFAVGLRSTANYPHTILSLASSLNMRYLDRPPPGAAGYDEASLVTMVKENEVARVLRSNGYDYIHLGSWWTPTATSPIADINLHIGGPSEFTSILEQTTALAPLASDDFRLRQWKRVQFQFSQLADLNAYRGPRFVFAHVTIPHSPYVFDPQGRYLSRAAVAGRGVPALYVAQLEYTNARILQLIDRLLAGPQGERPVIVLQSDEGPYEGEGVGWQRYERKILERKFGILNAYYLPGRPGGSPAPYPTITPVNSFRLILDRYFGARLPLLPDRDFAFHGFGGVYHFADVTDLVRPLV